MPTLLIISSMQESMLNVIHAERAWLYPSAFETRGGPKGSRM